MKGTIAICALALHASPSVCAPALAASGDVEIVIAIRDHRFVPPEVRIRSTTDFDVVLRIRNEDDTAEEIESVQLAIEEVVPGGGEMSIPGVSCLLGCP